MFGGTQVQEQFRNEYDGLITLAKAAKAQAETSFPAAFKNTTDILLDMLREIGTIRQNKRKCFSLATNAVNIVEQMKRVVGGRSLSSWEAPLEDFNLAFTTITDNIRSIARRNFLVRLFCRDSDASKLLESQQELESKFNRLQKLAAQMSRELDSPAEEEGGDLLRARRDFNNAHNERRHQHERNEEESRNIGSSPTPASQQSANRTGEAVESPADEEGGDLRKARKDLNNVRNHQRHRYQRDEELRKARSSPTLLENASRAPNQGQARMLRRENSELNWTRE